MQRRLVLLAALSVLVSCDDATDADLGSDAQLRVAGAQFFRGGPPEDASGPPVKSVNLSPIVRPGSVDRSCSGVLDPAATAVALSVDGDVGYWIVRAGIPELSSPGFPTFAASIAFSSSLGAGRRAFVARAVDSGGRFGPPLVRLLDVTPSALPVGKLVVRLSWSAHADLDLHLTDPRGVEIWKRNINSYEPPPPGAPPEPPNTPHPGGILDFDSHAACVPDGRFAENVVYTDKPPSGRYVARVDTASLCNAINVRWRVEAFIDGVSAGAAEGLSTEADAAFQHGRGAGVLALEVDVP